MSMGLTQIIRNGAEAIVNYRSEGKARFDRVADPAMLGLAANTAFLYGADMLYKEAEELQSFAGIAQTAASLGTVIGLYYINKTLVLPLIHKIMDMHERAELKRETRSAFSVARTATQAMLVGYLALQGNGHNAHAQNTSTSTKEKNTLSYQTTDEPNKDISNLLNSQISEAHLSGGNLPAEKLDAQLTRGLNQVQKAEPFTAQKAIPDTKIPDVKYTENDLQEIFTNIPGTSGVISKPDKKEDFQYNLRLLWEKKAKIAESDDAVNAVINTQVERYCSGKATKMTLSQYEKQIDKAIRNLKRNLDWHEAGKIKGLDEERTGLLQKISLHITGKDLLSYSLTELMGSSDGKRNAKSLDYLLREAGREYVELIPALYDDKTSFGPYQFTEYALYDADGEQRGASLINHALPEKYRIVGSVSKLKGNEHHKAAYLFAINNLAELISRLSRKEFNTLGHNWRENKDDIVSFMATAHHLPNDAISAARRWLDNDARFDYAVSCGPRIAKYAKKTGSNFDALYNK